MGLILPYRLQGAWGQAAKTETVTISLERLQSPWDSASFNFGSGPIPGIAVRLPGGSLTTISRICPHERCFTDLLKDTSQVFRETTYEPSGPVLVCPCHSSVFDLLDGGKVLYGPARRPPDRFKFQIEGDKIIITGLQQSR